VLDYIAVRSKREREAVTTEPPQPPSAPPPPEDELPAEPPPGTPANLADWGTRALGLLIDWAPLFILSIITLPSSFLRNTAGIVGLLYWLYMGHLDGVLGQTPGKAIMGTRVVNIQGELIGSGSGMARKIAHIIDSIVCFLGWLLPIVDANRQTIADKVMTTYVVAGVERKRFAVELWLPPKR
jgi:uncharacterized RDD family membrane protein YckC